MNLHGGKQMVQARHVHARRGKRHRNMLCAALSSTITPTCTGMRSFIIHRMITYPSVEGLVLPLCPVAGSSARVPRSRNKISQEQTGHGQYTGQDSILLSDDQVAMDCYSGRPGEVWSVLTLPGSAQNRVSQLVCHAYTAFQGYVVARVCIANKLPADVAGNLPASCMRNTSSDQC